MKKILLLFIILLSYYSVIADETIVKFYMNDGSQPKEFKISDIEKLDFIHSNLSYQMNIFHKENGLKAEFDIRDIDSIRFENSTKMIIAMNTEIIEQNISDIDSIIFVWNSCEEIQIGNQIWMCKNLDVDHYRNGDTIPQVTDPYVWSSLTTGAWCYYNNDSSNNSTYGKLYNWYAVNDPRGLAPIGWHVPSHNEWTMMENYLIANGYNFDGTTTGNKIAKSLATTIVWVTSTLVGSVGNTDYPSKRNATGFSALPGGWRFNGGSFTDIGYHGIWWSATEYKATYAWHRYMNSHSTNINRGFNYKGSGYSVRCVKD